MYPIQAIISGILSIFGTDANISAIKDNNKNSIFSGFVLGTILGTLLLGGLALNIDKYILFMNMDIEIYKTFAIYSVVQMFLQLLLNLSLCKLYYEGDNKRANKYTLLFNLINFSTLIIISIMTKNHIIITSISLIATSIFTLLMVFRTVKITGFEIYLGKCIKYDSVDLFTEVSMFIIYLFGFRNMFNFGEMYILATSFTALITDTQWDMSNSIKTAAQIDITKKLFSYKQHIKHSKNLILSVFIMGLAIYPIYRSDLNVTLLILSMELICLCLSPVYITKLTFIQLEHSAVKATLNKQIANILRIFCSFIPSPFCTSIGLVVSVIYQLLSTHLVISKN